MVTRLLGLLAVIVALRLLSSLTLFGVRGTARTQPNVSRAQDRLNTLMANAPPRTNVYPPRATYDSSTGDIAYQSYCYYASMTGGSATWNGSYYDTYDTWNGNCSIG